MSNQTPKYPVRLHKHNAIVVIRLPKPMGGSAKVFLRNVGNKEVEDLYHFPIQVDIKGRSNTGQPIPIDKVGKWLFGVPGYMGHVRVSNWEGTDCKVEFPADSPTEVHALIEAIKKRVEEKK